MTATGTQHPRPLRADAERNRDRVLAAAREVFHELGADAPLLEIARRAGVGPATLYRRFPARESLFLAVFADRLGSCDDSVQAAVTNPDPWRGLVDHLSHLAALQLEDRAFTAVFLYQFPAGSPISRSRKASGRALRRLLAAAKDAGELRPEVTTEDIMLFLKAHDGVLRWAANPQAESQRFLATLLRAFHA